MKIRLASLLLIVSLIYACSHTGKNALLSTPADMPASEYTINTERDTILVTKNGALLKIPQGAIDAGNKKQVTLEIKEAYTIAQMIKAGLTTSSGEEPMSSGGMIYIKPKKGQDATIKKAIDVALPTRYKDPEMKLFKGEESSDGRINWVKPDTLPVTALDNNLANGKALYNAKCSSCHKLGQKITGPDLAHYLRQYSGDTLLVRGYALHLPNYFWGDSFKDTSIKNPLFSKLAHINNELWSNQFTYFCNQANQYGSIGTNFPELREDDYDAIYRYVQNESDLLQLPDPGLRTLNVCIDSCDNYYKRYNELRNRQEELENTRQKQIEENGFQTEEIRKPGPVAPPDTVTRGINPVFDDREVVNPANQQAVYYQFSIETFGWYNIDVVLKEVLGNTKTELSVRITGSYREKLDVFLIIPDKKIYTKGGLKNDGSGNYVFAYTDGTIYLPLQAKAYILGLTENVDGIAFGFQQFTISSSQIIELELKSSSGEFFDKTINSLNMSDMRINSAVSRNAESIRKADSNLRDINLELKKAELLRPKNCDCDCGSEGDSRSHELMEQSQK